MKTRKKDAKCTHCCQQPRDPAGPSSYNDLTVIGIVVMSVLVLAIAALAVCFGGPARLIAGVR